MTKTISNFRNVFTRICLNKKSAAISEIGVEYFSGHPASQKLLAEHEAENRMIGRAFAAVFGIGCVLDLLVWLF